MNGCKKVVASALVVLILISSVTTAAYGVRDEVFWQDGSLYSVLEYDGVSNCTLDFAFVKVKYDYEAHRVYLLFMLTYTAFDDAAKSGVKMDFDGIGTVEMYCDGTEKYNSDLFFAQMEELSDPITCTQYLEVTLGIKEGIPEKLVMSVSFTDTYGDASNTFKVDITPENADGEPTEEEPDENKTTEKKTKKVKTTKPKTTKVRTTKTKTTKAKKTSKSKTNDETPYSANRSGEKSAEQLKLYSENSNKKTVLIIGAAAVALMIAAGCAVALINKEKAKKSGGRK